MGGKDSDLVLRHLFERAVGGGAHAAELIALVGLVDGKDDGKQRGKEQGRQGDGQNSDGVPFPGGQHRFDTQAADTPLIFHLHARSLPETMRPSSMRRIRSAIWAISSLWVIMTMVWENFWLVIFIRLNTS